MHTKNTTVAKRPAVAKTVRKHQEYALNAKDLAGPRRGVSPHATDDLSERMRRSLYLPI